MKHKPTDVASLRARAREADESGKTAAWRKIYLEALSNNCGQKTAAAKSAGVTVRTVQRLRASDPRFEQRESEALLMAMDVAEDEARRRAVDGVERIRRHTAKNGAVYEHIERKYSDRILLRLLERLETGSWRQKQQVEHSSGLTLKTRSERKAALEQAREAEQAPATGINQQS
jgi:hypothetical protein